MTAVPISRRPGPAPEQPLAGVTIVEFGYFYAMPYALAMAAALGARVIKVEDGAGDPHRNSFGPEVASHKTTAGKESLSVDLRTPAAQAIVRKLVATADVFVTGFRSGVAERLGLGYEELSMLNPRLLYVHAAGYGCEGPYAQRALYAQAAQAVGGSFGRQVGYWMDPEQSEGMNHHPAPEPNRGRRLQRCPGFVRCACSRDLSPADHRRGPEAGDEHDRRQCLGV
jgi:crotonobetainyl-CoA:carnitine CoA-transferase CaiB-like acyl-CoA transferase